MTNYQRLLVPYIAVVVSAVAIFQGLAVRGDQEVIQESLLQGCERGNALRVTLQGTVRRDIQRSKTTPARLFPNIPEKQFKKLIRESVQAQRADIHDLAPVDCDSVFPGDD